MNAYFGLCLCTILLVKRKFQVACSHGQQDSAAEHKLDFSMVTQNAGLVLEPDGFLAVLSSNGNV